MSGTAFDLFLSEEVQALLDDFAALLDIRVTFFSADGVRVCRGKAMRNCEFCRIIQEELGEFEACQSLDFDKQREVAEKCEVLSYRCHAGLYEGISPVCIRDRLAGFLMIGQYRVGDAPPTEALERCQDASRRQRLLAAFEELPKFTPEKLQSILGLFRTLIDYIAVRELAVVQCDRLRLEIDHYIEKHGDGDIRLPEMAKKLGRSVSTISQFLRRNHHTTFKELVTEHRLHRAEQFWIEHPEATVAEAAFAAGFTDQFYFSRVFRRHRGISPGAFREKLRRKEGQAPRS